MSDTWLHHLMEQFQIPSDLYDQIQSLLISKSSDMAEKCELLQELLNNLDSTRSEKFVRLVLENLQAKTVDSLLNPDSHSQHIKRSAMDKLHQKGSSSSLVDDFKSIQESVDLHFKQISIDDEDEVDEEYQSLSPLKLLQSLFANLPLDQIQQALVENNFNIEGAMDSLFGREVAVESKPPKQVCRHFMVGQCYRSDCWFSHDPDSVLCKFWLAGRCNKGDNCEFSHGQVVEQFVPKEAKPVTTERSLPPSIEDFPALGNVPSKQKIDFLAPTKAYNSTVNTKAAPKTMNERMYEQLNDQKKQKVDTKWLSTGNTLSTAYTKHRTEAIDVALHRNSLFQRATEAYLQGNRAAAKALSLRAHQLNNQLVNLHKEAADKIFHERNSNLSFENGEAVVDLHGLHPLEATDKLNEIIKSLKNKRYKGKLIIITGTGHHSRGQSKVLPAVKGHLVASGWKPKEATLSDGRGGILYISI